MAILAFDTCFGACSVALLPAGGSAVTAERFEAMDKGHSERLVPMIGEVLADGGVGIAAVRTIAVTVGPGSFTGVRTGIAVARGLALAAGLEICGTDSLHVMAAGLRENGIAGPIAIAAGTRDGLVYFATFDGLDVIPAIAACLTTPGVAAMQLAGRLHTIAGSGAALILAEAAAAHTHHAAPLFVRAATLARMAPRLPLLTPPKPLYLREPDAKPQAAADSAQATTRI
jgi:tRNA threonylcarbamoyladenosine biosynthesis protein TsaB